MKELIQYEISAIRAEMKDAELRNDLQAVRECATRIITLRARLASINRQNWYSTRKIR